MMTITTAFAWLSQNKNVQGQGANVVISDQGLNVEYKFYKYDHESTQVIEVSSPQLNNYDTIISQNNINTALIIQCMLQRPKNLDIEIICSVNDTTTFCISNISNYRFITDDDITEVNLTTYSDLINRSTNIYKFVQNNNKSTTIQSSLDEAAQVFVIIDYDEDLINTLNNGEPYLSDDLSTTISFQSDLVSIVFSEQE